MLPAIKKQGWASPFRPQRLHPASPNMVRKTQRPPGHPVANRNRHAALAANGVRNESDVVHVLSRLPGNCSLSYRWGYVKEHARHAQFAPQ